MKKQYHIPIMEIIPIQAGYLMEMPTSEHGDPGYSAPERREPPF